MSYARRPLPPPRPYGTRPIVARPYGVTPVPGGYGAGAGAGALGTALGAIGGTLGCLLCLAAIGALGLFSCVVAITAYTKKFLNQYKSYNQINGVADPIDIGFILLLASLCFTFACRMQRN